MRSDEFTGQIYTGPAKAIRRKTSTHERIGQ